MKTGWRHERKRRFRECMSNETVSGWSAQTLPPGLRCFDVILNSSWLHGLLQTVSLYVFTKMMLLSTGRGFFLVCTPPCIHAWRVDGEKRRREGSGIGCLMRGWRSSVVITLSPGLPGKPRSPCQQDQQSILRGNSWLHSEWISFFPPELSSTHYTACKIYLDNKCINEMSVFLSRYIYRQHLIIHTIEHYIKSSYLSLNLIMFSHYHRSKVKSYLLSLSSWVTWTTVSPLDKTKQKHYSNVKHKWLNMTIWIHKNAAYVISSVNVTIK